MYRRYAGLFFCICVDANDNELAYLEAIHLFVEVLGNLHCIPYLARKLLTTTSIDAFFENVCELDLVFNFYKVCTSFESVKSSNPLRRCMQFSTRFSLQEKSKRRVKRWFFRGWMNSKN